MSTHVRSSMYLSNEPEIVADEYPQRKMTIFKMRSLNLTTQVSISMSGKDHFGQRTIFYLLAGQLCQTLNTPKRKQDETFSMDSDETVECSVCIRYIQCWKYLC